MPGGSKKGGGLKSSPVYKKQAFGIARSPFMMKGFSYPGESPKASPARFLRGALGALGRGSGSNIGGLWKGAFGIWDQSRSYNRGDSNKQKWWTVDTEREAMLRSRGMNPRINRERMMTNVGRPQSWGGVGGTYELA